MPLLLNRYCQWVAQFLALWQSPQRAPWLQRGHASQARRLRSAVGSIGNTINRPIRQHTGAHQLVVDPLLLRVEVGVQHVVGLLFLGEYRNRIPVVADSLQRTAERRRASSRVRS